jgi:hypothetical protein
VHAAVRSALNAPVKHRKIAHIRALYEPRRRRGGDEDAPALVRPGADVLHYRGRYERPSSSR